MKTLLPINRVLVIPTIIFISFIFLFNGCSGKITSTSVSCSTRLPDETVALSFNSDNGVFNFSNVLLWKFPKQTIQYDADISYPDLNDLLPKSISDKPESFLILFYIDKLLENDSAFSEKDIAAISRFTLKGKLLQHDFFQREDNNYKQLKPLSIKISIITVNAVQYIRNNIVFKDGGNETTMFWISNGEKINFRTRDHYDYLIKAAKTLATSLSSESRSYQ